MQKFRLIGEFKKISNRFELSQKLSRRGRILSLSTLFMSKYQNTEFHGEQIIRKKTKKYKLKYFNE